MEGTDEWSFSLRAMELKLRGKYRLVQIGQAWFEDISVGLGQVKIKTAKTVEDNGYIAKHPEGTAQQDKFYRERTKGSLREINIFTDLYNPVKNIYYASAYCRMLYDQYCRERRMSVPQHNADLIRYIDRVYNGDGNNRRADRHDKVVLYAYYFRQQFGELNP